MSLCIDQFVIDGRDGVLPDQFFGRNFRAEIAGARAHVAVGQLEPGPGEGLGELVGMLVEASGDRLVDRVEAQGQVAVVIIGADFLDGSCASGIMCSGLTFFGIH